MSDGFFPPESAMWRLNREHFVLLGGSAAAILQAVHPMVAMGVAAHSEFRDDALGRLRRTLEAVYAIAFGTKENVEQVMRTVRAAHAKVNGDTPQKYSAMDPDAQMWVLATLIMTTVEMHRRCATLPPARHQPARVYETHLGEPQSLRQSGRSLWSSWRIEDPEMGETRRLQDASTMIDDLPTAADAGALRRSG